MPIRAPAAFVSALAVCWFLFPTQVCVCVCVCVSVCVWLGRQVDHGFRMLLAVSCTAERRLLASNMFLV